mgnify:CR=1 FL=1
MNNCLFSNHVYNNYSMAQSFLKRFKCPGPASPSQINSIDMATMKALLSGGHLHLPKAAAVT